MSGASSPRRRLAALVVLAVAASPAAVAGAATKNGITPLAPKLDAAVAKGKAATFRMRVRGSGAVFVHVCKTPRKSKRDGTICSTATIGQAKRHNGVFSYTQRLYDYPAYWLNTPGTYYWQAFRIACRTGNVSDCNQEGPVVRFHVR